MAYLAASLALAFQRGHPDQIKQVIWGNFIPPANRFPCKLNPFR